MNDDSVRQCYNCRGDGFYQIGCDFEEIIPVKEYLKSSSGIVVIKCYALMASFAIGKVLNFQKYCSCFSFENLMSLEYITNEVR